MFVTCIIAVDQTVFYLPLFVFIYSELQMIDPIVTATIPIGLLISIFSISRNWPLLLCIKHRDDDGDKCSANDDDIDDDDDERDKKIMKVGIIEVCPCFLSMTSSRGFIV